QAATIYSELNQYHVIMEWAPRFTQGPNALAGWALPAKGIRAGTPTAIAAAANAASAPLAANPGSRDSSTGNALSNTVTPLVPLDAVARFVERATDTSVSHQDGELATTISFNLAPGKTLADATAAIKQSEADIAMPSSARGSLQGPPRAAKQSRGREAILIAPAIVVIYLVLGMLYESLIHPITV